MKCVSYYCHTFLFKSIFFLIFSLWFWWLMFVEFINKYMAHEVEREWKHENEFLIHLFSFLCLFINILSFVFVIVFIHFFLILLNKQWLIVSVFSLRFFYEFMFLFLIFLYFIVVVFLYLYLRHVSK